MKLIRGLHNLNYATQPCAATIGNFDGLHRGHQHIIEHVCEQAEQRQLISTAITFEPSPTEYFSVQAGTTPPGRIYPFRDKIFSFKNTALEQLISLNFNQALADMEAETFVKSLLIQQLNVKYLVVGDDFRFGKQRKGDFDYLKKVGAQCGMDVSDTPTISQNNQRISSTRIRTLLASGDIKQAADLLGRPYTLSGRIRHGDKRGRTIGFPTINMLLPEHIAAKNGVYIVLVHGLASKPLQGVANLGNRPTFSGTETRLETHLFDTEGDLYGQYAQVELLQLIRPEIKFDDFKDLLAQIEQDATQARAYFQH